MKSNILEILGGAFIFTALTYSTGKGYFNSYFREISVDPTLIDMAIDQIFFEGGRQLVSIINEHLASISISLILYVLICRIASELIKNKFGINRASDISSTLSAIKNILLVGFFVWFSNYSFNSAISSGREAGSKGRCIPAIMHTTSDSGAVSGCLVHKTVDNIWIKHESNGEIVISIFPRDNFYRLDTAPRQ